MNTHGKACAKLHRCWKGATNAGNQEIFRSRSALSLTYDEGKCRAIVISRNSGLVRRVVPDFHRDQKDTVRTQSRTSRRKETVLQISPESPDPKTSAGTHLNRKWKDS